MLSVWGRGRADAEAVELHEARAFGWLEFRPMTAGGGLILDLKCRLPATPARVFEALTSPDQLSQWWGPSGFTSPSLDFDPRVGGGYRITMQPPDGEAFHLSGEFREVDSPLRLAYTFRWEEPDPDDQETVVTLTLRDLDDATELTLAQGPFATEGRRALHEQGWSESFERMRAVISSGA